MDYGVVEDLKKVAYLQGQLDNTITQLQEAICDLHDIIGKESEDALGRSGEAGDSPEQPQPDKR